MKTKTTKTKEVATTQKRNRKTADERTKIIGVICEWLLEGKTRMEVGRLLASEYSVIRANTVTEWYRSALKLLETNENLEKSITYFVAKCERIYTEAMTVNRYKDAIEVLKLQARICGVIDNDNQNNLKQNQIQLVYE